MINELYSKKLFVIVIITTVSILLIGFVANNLMGNPLNLEMSGIITGLTTKHFVLTIIVIIGSVVSPLIFSVVFSIVCFLYVDPLLDKMAKKRKNG